LRLLLIAEDFDPALLISAEWLHENYNVDIRCYRLQLSREGENDYMTCTCVYPPIEIAALVRGTGSQVAGSATAWGDWDAALESVENNALKGFVRAETARGQESRLPYREIIYRFDGKRRIWLSCRRKYAYVWQRGRFDGDEAYWRKGLSEPTPVVSVENNHCLRFRLTSPEDFQAFRKATNEDLTRVEFTDSADFGPPSEDAIP
jgi:hypothetical protein